SRRGSRCAQWLGTDRTARRNQDARRNVRRADFTEGSRMKSVLTIAQHELRRIFVSPLAWTVLAVAQLILGLVFVLSLADYTGNPDMTDQYAGVSDYVGAGLFGFATIVLLLVMPLMTMRLFAEERKSGSIDLLFSAPVSLTQIVLGKF